MRHVNWRGSYGGGGPVAVPRATPWVRNLLIANAAIFLLTVAVGFERAFELLAFSPARALTRPWAMLTYMFVHAGLWHLLMNLLIIYFFGPPLEERWGSDRFIKFYLVCGLGGALLSFAFSDSSIVGASAACYGLLLAFAMAWPNRTIYIWALVPVRVKWLVAFLVALSLMSAMGSGSDGTAHLAHLGGAGVGFLLVASGWLPKHGGGAADIGSWGPGTGWPRSRGRGRSGRSVGMDGIGRRLRRWVAEVRGQGARGGRSGAGTAREVQFGNGATRQDASRRRSGQLERDELDLVDAVLDKISSHGIESLTAEERELLDRMSRRESRRMPRA